jgi:small subunit ribosomal protein S17
MSDESTEKTETAEETQATEAPAAEAAPAAPAAPEPEPAEPDPLDDLPRKERLRILKSREPHKAGPQRTTEERIADREAVRKQKANERRKERAAMKAEHEPSTGTPVAEREANAAKVRQGIVVSNKGDKSITVRIDIARRHPTYEKIVRRSRTLHAHDERNEAGEGDMVRIVETRPLSKTKRWRLVDVVEKAR